MDNTISVLRIQVEDLTRLLDPYQSQAEPQRIRTRSYSLPWEHIRGSMRLLHDLFSRQMTWSCSKPLQHAVHLELEHRLQLEAKANLSHASLFRETR